MEDSRVGQTDSVSEEARIREAIESAQTYAADEISVDTVLQKLADGFYQAWVIDTITLVTCVANYENHSRLRICYAAGDLTDELIAKALDIIERFAAAVGCVGVEIYGRGGWVRRLKNYGYNQQYVVVMKRI
jgi:hypothetical protein